MTTTKEASDVQKMIGDIAPKMAELTDGILFGDIWKREELSPRDRSLITVAALISGGNTQQLPFHLNKARENGISEAELIGVITHLAFYVGWPKAMSAFMVAKGQFSSNNISKAGQERRAGPEKTSR